MGDHRAGSSGTTAIAVSAPIGKRVARHSAEQRTSTPYVGRRVARVAATPAPVPAHPSGEALPYAGRRVARHMSVAPAPIGVESIGVVGRRIAIEPGLASEPDDVAVHLLQPTVTPALAPSSGCGIAGGVRLIIEPVPELETALDTVLDTVLQTGPAIVLEPVPEPVPVPEPAPAPVLETVEPAVLVTDPELHVRPEQSPGGAPAAKRTRPAGRRAATRRPRIPSLPLLAGVAVLAVSAGGALQAMHPGLAGADAAGHLSPAGALSGSSAVSTASLLGGRGTVVSRSSDRTTLTAGGSLQAAADAQAKQRDAALSEFAAKAEKNAAQIKLHQWVLPITPGAYHLTARFGDYSSLWSHFHTGLDFAAPTGTPIMAIAGGTITDVGYSGAYGDRTIERLPDGTELWYCHQNEFGTSVGATVKPGQVIGYVGSTGNVTGPHLHLEVHPGGGDPVDPYPALVVHGLNP